MHHYIYFLMLKTLHTDNFFLQTHYRVPYRVPIVCFMLNFRLWRKTFDCILNFCNNYIRVLLMLLTIIKIYGWVQYKVILSFLMHWVLWFLSNSTFKLRCLWFNFSLISIQSAITLDHYCRLLCRNLAILMMTLVLEILIRLLI